jgi:hypothetical protein
MSYSDRLALMGELHHARELLRNAMLCLSDHGEIDGDNCEECREMVSEINAVLPDAYNARQA